MAKQSVKKAVRPAATPEMRTDAVDFYIANREANNASTRARGLRKTLYKSMVKGGLDHFEHEATIGNKRVALNVWVGQKEDSYIDPKVIYKEIDLDDFLALVTISKTRLKEFFPEDFARFVAMSETPSLCPENVHVEEVKV